MDFSVFNLRISWCVRVGVVQALLQGQLSNFLVAFYFETDEGERTTGKLTGGGGEADRETGRYSAELD